MKYILMRKNEPLTMLDISEEGNINKVLYDHLNKELAPLHNQNATNWIQRWWQERSVPISQGHIKNMLFEKGYVGPEEYLVKNLGLSLSDYYWIKPVDSSLTWEKVNLFDNDFKGSLSVHGQEKEENNECSEFTPNSSLQGELQKSWIIIDGNRFLIKGNRDNLSSESINEVIASQIHHLQGYDNYTDYNLIKIRGQKYDYGCCSQLFTSQNLEFLSAYGVISSCKSRQDISSYEQFIQVCGNYGIDMELLRADLEYQILSDFIMSNNDRHLNNVGILRDADTLKFLRMAPIYDTGKSFCVGDAVCSNTKDILSIKTNSFTSTELRLLKYVTDKNRLDVSKLPDKKFIIEAYEKDTQIDSSRIQRIAALYESKVDMLERFQKGYNLDEIKRSFTVSQQLPSFVAADETGLVKEPIQVNVIMESEEQLETIIAVCEEKGLPVQRGEKCNLFVDRKYAMEVGNIAIDVKNAMVKGLNKRTKT